MSIEIEAENVSTPTLVSDGSVDCRGKIADKRYTGGWKAAPFIIVNEVAERLAFFSVAVSMVPYLVGEMHQPLPEAAAHINNWIGACYALTLLGAFFADAYLGRFLAIITFSSIYAGGMLLLTLSGSVSTRRPPHCNQKPCIPATASQAGFLYAALALIAVGTGGIKPCVSSFGADQFDQSDEKESQQKYSFFNWFFFAISAGGILGITLLVYVRVEMGWPWGFGVPTAAVVASVLIFAAGYKKYRYQRPAGSPFTRFLQVIVSALRSHARGVQSEDDDNLYEVDTKESDIQGAKKLAHTQEYRFFDKAAVLTSGGAVVENRWKLCTVTQVEEFKAFLRILPIWATTIALSISFAQTSTFFLGQAAAMDRRLGRNFEIPPSSIAIFNAICAPIIVPLYEKIFVPFLRSRTGLPRGITSLQRMGVGLFLSIFAMVSAAVVEKNRREESVNSRLSVFWLFPQYFFIGTAEVFTYVGQLEFFYDEATDGTRSISSAVFLSEFGIGSWLSTAIVKLIQRWSGGVEHGWFRDNLNQSRLENLYWILMGINAVNFLVYLWVAKRYKGKRSE